MLKLYLLRFLTIENVGSVFGISQRIAEKMMNFYTGNRPGQTPGALPPPYYWWEAGAVFGVRSILRIPLFS